MSETVIIEIDRVIKKFKEVYIVDIRGEKHPFEKEAYRVYGGFPFGVSQ